MSDLCGRESLPILFGGDFNLIRSDKERNVGQGDQKLMTLFNDFIGRFHLRELFISGAKFTWSNKQKHPILVKLDRILVSNSWENLFPTTIVTRLPREISDHNPLILSTGQKQNLPKLEFRFNLGWLSNPEFIELTRQPWEKPCKAKSALDKMQQKLKLFKQYFKG